jgi:DNA-directed RNA polymerase specialized sigma24 family protein
MENSKLPQTENAEPVVKKKRGRKKKIDTCSTSGTLEAAPIVILAVKKKNYVNNADLMKELAKSKEAGAMTNELAKMLQTLCTKYAKHPDYKRIYSYDEDMKAFAMLTIVKVWKSFNPEKTNNPFAYFTQVLRHAFYQYLNSETKQRTIKDEILISVGELPSYNYMENFREDGQEHDMGSEVLTKSYREYNESPDSGGDSEAED